MMLVVCGLIRRRTGGQVLLCRRAPGRSWAGFYEFPGGKVEPGETPEAALLRELEEELHLPPDSVILGPMVAENSYPGGADGPAIRLLAYEVLLTADVRLPGELVLHRPDYNPTFVEWRVTDLPAHDDLAWVPPGRLSSFAMPPADVPIANFLDHPNGPFSPIKDNF